MCGRFNVVNTPGLQALLTELGASLELPAPLYNVAPTEPVPLLRRRDGDCSSAPARWWLTPSWAKESSQKYAMFNARREGLVNSPAFKKPFASQRGIVPISSFIEWRGAKGDKQPWLISNEVDALAVAALWDVWISPGIDEKQSGGLLSCTLVTTGAADRFKPWHSRMPVLLYGADRERWLDNSQRIDANDQLFAPRLREPWRLLPIHRAVGNARHKGSEALAPVGDEVILPESPP